MGMFQAQNYGADFVNAMTATSGMMNDRRKLDMEEQKQAKDAQTRDLQNEGLQLDNQKKSADAEEKERLTNFMEMSARLNNGSLEEKDFGTLAGLTIKQLEDTPYLPNDPSKAPEYRQAITKLISGVQQLRTLPVTDYKYSRDDNVPEVNTVLDGYQTLLSKNRLGKEFVDADGSITGKAGSSYKTAGVGGFAMRSGEGDKAAFTPLFSVTDAQGNPIVGADGRMALVPSTEGETNDPNAKLRMITPEEMLTKAGYATHVLNVVDKLGLADPEKRKQYISANLPAYLGEEGAREMLKNNDTTLKLTSIDPTHDVYAGTKKIQAGVPKAEKDTPHIAHNVGVGGGQEQDFQYNKKTGRYDIPLGRPTAKHAPKSAGEGAEAKAKAKAGGKAIKEIIDEYQALKVKRNAQWSKDLEELRKVNADRTLQGGAPLSYHEYFGSSSAHAAITQDMYQLRDVAMNSHSYDLINMETARKQPASSKTSEQGMAPRKTQGKPAIGRTANPASGRPPLSSFMSAATAPSWEASAKPATTTIGGNRVYQNSVPTPVTQHPKPAVASRPSLLDGIRRNTFAPMQAESGKMQEDKKARDISKVRAVAANIDPAEYVDAYNDKGKHYRTPSRNARFNTTTLRWEMK